MHARVVLTLSLAHSWLIHEYVIKMKLYVKTQNVGETDVFTCIFEHVLVKMYCLDGCDRPVNLDAHDSILHYVKYNVNYFVLLVKGFTCLCSHPVNQALLMKTRI